MKKLKKDLEELGYQDIELPDFRISYEVPSTKKMTEKNHPVKKANALKKPPCL